MKIVYFGTPQFAADVLSYLLQYNVQIVAVVTQPDRPKGRSLEILPSPVKQIAKQHIPEIPISQPEKASDPAFLEALIALRADLFVVVAFGQILPQKLLDIPPLGCINVHASLLPKYRGAAPIHRVLIHGDTKTGVAIQKMVKQLDAGDVIATSEMNIPAEMTFGELEKALCELSKPLLLSVIHLYHKGIPNATSQDHSAATYASKVELEEGKIDWSQAAEPVHNLIRAFSPRPGAWCWVEVHGERKRLKIFRTRVAHKNGQPGEISSEGLAYCGTGALELLEVQPEGKKIMAASDWLRGFKKPPALK